MATAQEVFTILKPDYLPYEIWWEDLHALIIEAFLDKPENVTVFPPDWKRLADDPAIAAQNLASELGDRGWMGVLLNDQKPIACAGVLPYRGMSWINDAQKGKSDADIANAASSDSHATPEWEICCFCVSTAHRGQGISHRVLASLERFIEARGAKRLYANYAEIATGKFWPRMGFEVVGPGGVLKKGFKFLPEKEGLRGDVVHTVAMKKLRG